MFRLSTFVPLGGVLYPWRCRTTITEEFIVIGLVPSPPVWNIRPDQFGSHRLPVHPTSREFWLLNTEASGARFVVSPWNKR
jgi:hypothetical protein